MKKAIIIVGVSLLLCGCNNKEKQTEKLTELAHKYYNNYGINLKVDEYVVTISDLKKANKELKQKYDLKLFDECKESTEAILTIENKTITKTKINLSC